MNLNRTPIQIYALAVCFAALICFVITLGILAYDLVQISVPEFTYNPPSFSVDLPPKPGTNQYEEAIMNERNRATRSLVQTSIILLIDLGVFIFHWRVANRVVQ